MNLQRRELQVRKQTQPHCKMIKSTLRTQLHVCTQCFFHLLHRKYFLQPLTKRMSHEKLYNKIDQNIDRLILTYQFFSGIGLGKIVNRFLPVCDLDNTLPGNLPSEKLRELCLLDTFDMFSPEFDKPQKIKTSKSWFTRYGMEKVWGGYVKYENCDAAVVKGIKRTD